MRKLISILTNQLRVFRGVLLNRVYISRRDEQDVTHRFHHLYWTARIFNKTVHSTTFLGTRAIKCPLDLWVYQEIIVATKPDIIIETGTKYGGSGLFLASICQLLDRGRVITVDIQEQPDRPQHARLTYVTASSSAPDTLQVLRSMIKPADRVMLILDSDHTKAHVLAELRLLGPLVTRGNYLIVEDTCLNGHPIVPDYGPGPMEAVHEFLQEARDFEIDKGAERHYLTFNPSGYLRRVR